MVCEVPLRRKVICGLGRPESSYWYEVSLNGDVRLSYDHRVLPESREGDSVVLEGGKAEAEVRPIPQALRV